ncbi:hypothetical protein VB154_18585 [Xanthomonas fragariae]|nr:hypothetical protein [Xanthomonas fragariae]
MLSTLSAVFAGTAAFAYYAWTIYSSIGWMFGAAGVIYVLFAGRAGVIVYDWFLIRIQSTFQLRQFLFGLYLAIFLLAFLCVSFVAFVAGRI